MEYTRLILRPDGMFSNVNEVIQQLYLAEKGNYEFDIDWSKSCYREDGLSGDPWNYYFEDCFPPVQAGAEPIRTLPSGVPIACSKNNIITPRLSDGQCAPLLLPKNRKLVNRIIKEYIQLKPILLKKLSSFQAGLPCDRILGLHIRGPGRIDGGAQEMSKKYPGKYGIPFSQYYKFVEAYLNKYSEANIFLCSDSQYVVNEVMQRYGDRVITYPASRSNFGEMHIERHPKNKGLVFSPYQLGEDVILEAYLLAGMDYLVHGNSNVTNFALCKNPELVASYIYAD